MITDLLSGRVQLSVQTPITVIPFVCTGRLKPVAVSGVIVPAKAPRAVIDEISKDLAAILGQPYTREFMAKQGSEVFISTPEQTTGVINVEIACYAKIFRSAGITYQP